MGIGNSLRLHTAACAINNFYIYVTGYRIGDIDAGDPILNVQADLIEDPDSGPTITITPNTDTSGKSFIYK